MTFFVGFKEESKVRRSLFVAIAGVLLATSLVAQPNVTLIGNNYGWVSPASPSFGIAQGAIFAIKGTDLGPTPYPTLNSTPVAGNDKGVTIKVTVGGTTVTAPTYYVWDQQLAAVLPSNTPVGTGTLTVNYNNQTSSTAPITVVQSAFGVLTMDSSGKGTAKVCDYNFGDGKCTSFPSLASSAKPGDVLTLWGAGLGPTANDAISVDLTATVAPKVWIGGKAAAVAYAARSQFVGLDFINTSIPADVPPGCYVSVVVQIGNYISNFTTLPVAANGGPCTDAVTGLTGDALGGITGKDSFAIGSVGLSHTLSETPSLPGVPGGDKTDETASAVFYRFKPIQYANVQQFFAQASFGSCTVWTFTTDQAGKLVGVDQPTPLNAGPITITSNGVAKAMQLEATSGVYFLDLQSPSFYGGNVTVAGAGGPDVGSFNTSINVPSGFTWANRADVSTVSRAAGQTITWQNAAAGTIVEMTGASITLSLEPTAGSGAVSGFVCLAPAEAGQFNIPSWVLLALPPTQSIQGITIPASLAVINSAKPVSFTAAGLDQGLLTFAITSSKSVTYQ
jgi:uncharacterized protein (TIGR03437 family)